ncbi:sugar phosphate isomerase/epimerase [Microbacterium oryzae]|uniref:Sugar phosphate isomerase/epimerase n=1 Tax=Microbacterium oryzae TaxID=743009 RepID=A0A6I6DS24_9MICO|nr:sugar phosphate isomerase/epimerase [Microbacterium oryzae]QGU27745.1 sugar phosphate isomerase/epimerase [Microbacterium oryzae]
MEIGLLTDSLGHLDRKDALDAAAAIGATRLEFAAGDWSTSPHLDLEELLASAPARAALEHELDGHGLALSALNASGNPLHPREGERNDALVRGTIRLAGALGVDTVVLMSGLPAGAPGDATPNWITTSWPPETTEILERQWTDVALPYWEDLARFATEQGVTKLAVEMHANQLVFSVPSLQRLRDAVGPIVGANLDPSHLFWMGADPLAAIQELSGAIHHVHAKDTRIEESVAVRSRVETLTVLPVAERSWNYVTVGRGHDVEYWARFMAALRAAGYDGTLSIEHEDHAVDPRLGVEEAAATLREAAHRASIPLR